LTLPIKRNNHARRDERLPILDFRRCWRGWLLTSEAILCFSKGEPSGWVVPSDQYDHDTYIHRRVGHEGVEGHPTVKPLWVVSRLVHHVDGLILDPYLGSGTLAVACERQGKAWLGAEIDDTFAAIAEKRIERERDRLQLPMEATP